MNVAFFLDQRDYRDTTTNRGDFSTFGLKVNHSKSLHHLVDRPNRQAINQLKNQIKFILNLGLHTKNETIDKYIFESFNVYKPDPKYVFVLPGSSNRTLEYHRSNFSDISFPNTTSLQTLQKILKSSKFAHLFPSHDEQIAKQLALNDRFFEKYKQFMSNENDLYEAESLKIVEENVRTERSFFKFMDKLNDGTDSDAEVSTDESDERQSSPKHRPTATDYSALIKTIHANDHVGNYELTKDNSREPVKWPGSEHLSWDDFGLHGWIGKINEEHDNPDENG